MAGLPEVITGTVQTINGVPVGGHQVNDVVDRVDDEAVMGWLKWQVTAS
jgi:hypothetical protein